MTCNSFCIDFAARVLQECHNDVLQVGNVDAPDMQQDELVS